MGAKYQENRQFSEVRRNDTVVPLKRKIIVRIGILVGPGHADFA